MAAGLGVEAGTLSVAIGPKLVEGFGSKIADILDKEVGPAADKAGKSLGDKLSKGFEKASKSISKNLTAPLLALGGTVIAAGLELDGAFDSIAVATGATGAELQGLQADFEAVATKSSASFETVAGTLSDLNARLGLTGQPLQDLTQQIVNLGEITGQSIDTEAVTGLFASFKVPAEEYQETLDRVFQISQATGVSFGELVQQAGAQAAQFQSFGFTVEESVSVLGQLEKSGVDATAVLGGLRKAVAKGLKGDKDAAKASEGLEKALRAQEQATMDLEVAEQKLAELEADPKAKQSALLAARNNVAKYQTQISDAGAEIEQFNKVIDESSKAAGVSTQQVFADTVGQIKALIDAGKDQEAQALALEVAGPRAYTNLIKAIEEGTLTAEGFTAAIDGNALSINEQFAATADFPEQLKIFKNAVTVELGKIGVEVFPVITDLFNQLLPVFKDLIVEGGKIAKDLIPEITKVIKFALPIIQSLVEFFLDLPGPVKDVAAKAIVLTAAFGPLLGKISPLVGVVSKLLPLFGKLGPVIAKSFTVLMANPAILGFIAAAAAIAAIVYVIYKNWDSIVAFFKGLWEDIAGFASDAWEAIKAVFGAVVDWFKNLWEDVVQTAKDVWAKLAGAATAAWDGIKRAFGAVLDFFRNLWNGTVQLAKDAWNGFVNIVKSVLDFVGRLIVGYVTAVYVVPFRTFVNIVKAIWDGIVAIARIVLDAVSAYIRTVVNAWGAIFRGIGTVVSTVWNGIKTIVSTAMNVVRTIISNAVGVIKTIWNGLTAPFRAVWDGLQNGVKAARDFVVGIITGLKDTILSLLDPRKLFGGIASGARDLLGNIGSAINPVNWFRANGGPVRGGNEYIVGERGPELFVPRTSGTIIPNHALAGMTGGGAQYNITVVNPSQEPASTSIPNALRRANYLRT